MSKKKQYDYQRIDRRTAQDDWYLQRRREIVAENNAIQKKPADSGIEISSPNDAHEQQADTIAKNVVNGGEVNPSTITPVSNSVQTKSEGESLTASPEFAGQLDSTKSSGQPLDDSTRTEMESKMGADFSGVKVHTDSASHALNDQVNAKAFTDQEHVYFNKGNYNPESTEGKELLAHELVHTVQQGNGLSRKIQRQPGGGEDPQSPLAQFYKNEPVSTYVAPSPRVAEETRAAEAKAAHDAEVKSEYDNYNSRLNTIIADANANKKPEPKTDPYLDKLEKWTKELTWSDETVRANARQNLALQKEAGWGRLLFTAYRSWEHYDSPGNASYLKQIQGYQQEIISMMSTWIQEEKQSKDQSGENKRGFLPYLVNLASLKNSVQSDYAVLLLLSNNLDATINFDEYKASIISELHLIRRKIRSIVPAEIDATKGYYKTFESQVDAEIRRVEQTTNHTSIAQAGMRTSELFVYLDSAQKLGKYTSVFNKALNGDDKNNNQPPKEESQLGVSRLVRGTQDDLYWAAANLPKAFSKDQQDIKDYHKAKRIIDRASISLENSIFRTMFSDFKSMLDQGVELCGSINDVASFDFPVCSVMLAQNHAYSIQFEAMKQLLPKLEELSKTNREAFTVFWQEQLQQIADSIVVLSVILTTMRLSYVYHILNESWTHYWKSDPKVETYLKYLKIDIKYSLTPAYYNALNKAATPSETNAILKSSSESWYFSGALALLQENSDFLSYEKNWNIAWGIIKGIAVMIVATVLTIITFQPEVEAVGIMAAVNLIITGFAFTVYAQVLNSLVFGGDPLANFGTELVKNIAFLWVFKTVGKALESFTEGMKFWAKFGVNLAATSGEVLAFTGYEFIAYNLALAFSKNPNDPELAQPFDIKMSLLQNAGFIIGVKMGMSVVNMSTRLITSNRNILSKESADKLNASANTCAKLLENLQFRDLTQTEWSKLFSANRESLRTIKSDVLGKKTTAKPSEQQQIDDLVKQISTMEQMIDAAELEMFRVRGSETESNLFYFEGDAEAFGKLITSGDPKSSFKPSPGDPNTYVFTSGKGIVQRYIKAGEGKYTSFQGERLGRELGFDWTEAVADFWKQAGDETMVGKGEGGLIVRDAVLKGWRPGKELAKFGDFAEQGKRTAGAFKQSIVETKFGSEEAARVSKAATDLPADALNRILKQISSVDQLNLLLEYFPEDAAQTNLVKVEETYIDRTDLDGNRTVRIFNASNLGNALSIRLYTDIPKALKLDKVLATEPVESKENLQNLINTLSDNGLQLFIDLQGKMEVPQLELVERAKTGDALGFDLKQTIDYFDAEAISSKLSGDAYVNLLDIKNRRSILDHITGKDADYKYQGDREKLDAAREKMKSDPTTAKTELEAIQRRLEIKLRIETAGNKFELNYSDIELDNIYKKGKELGLSDKAIEDFIFTGSRKAKSITAEELMKQMDNNVNVVNKRGYPFKFESKEQFDQFGQDYKKEVTDNNLPANDIEIQGSVLRSENAKDVDSVIFVTEAQFDQYLIDRYDGKIKKNGKAIDLTSMSHNDLANLAEDILTNRKDYNNQADGFRKTFADQMFNSKSDILKPIKTIRISLDNKYPNLNIETISVQVRGGKFDIQPSMKIK